MLMNRDQSLFALDIEKNNALSFLHPDFQKYRSDDDHILAIEYPVRHYPEKIKAINLDKTHYIKETLSGIRGQYLIFESGAVINIRKHGGYMVELIW